MHQRRRGGRTALWDDAIRADLETAGQPIGGNDLLIAALARALTLVTANEREFRRIRGLVAENWLVTRG